MSVKIRNLREEIIFKIRVEHNHIIININKSKLNHHLAHPHPLLNKKKSKMQK